MKDEEIKNFYNCTDASVPTYRCRLNSLWTLIGKSEMCGEEFDPKDFFSYLSFYEVVRSILDSKYSSLTKQNFLKLLRPMILNASELSELNEWIEMLEIAYREEGPPTDLIPLAELRSKIASIPDWSKEKMVMEILCECPVRDDLQVKCISADASVDLPKDENLLIMSIPLKLLIQKSKNIGQGRLAPRIFELSLSLSKRIIEYIKSLPKHLRTYPFGRAKMSKSIGKMLLNLGLKESRDSINFIRKVVATEARRSNDIAVISQVAYRSLHNGSTLPLYESVTTSRQLEDLL